MSLLIILGAIAGHAIAANDGIVVAKQMGVAAGVWRFNNGAEFPGAEGRLMPDSKDVLHLQYDFTHGGAYVAAYCDLKTPAPLGRVTFSVRAPGDAQLTVRATDSGDQTFQKSVSIEAGDWQRVECSMRDWTGHWGGPNDGVLHNPIKTVGILIERQGLSLPGGELLIRDFAADAEAGGASAEHASGPFDGSYVVTDFGNDAGFGVDGPGALKDGVWSIDFSKGDRVSLHHSLSLFGKPRELELKVSGGQPGNTVAIEIGSHFQGFQRMLGTLTGTEQTFTVPMPPEGWTHSGAEEHGISYPVRLSAVTVERGTGPASATEVKLISLRCATTVDSSRVITLLAQVAETRRDSGWRTLRAKCTAWNLANDDTAAYLFLVTSDWEGREVSKVPYGMWRLPARGLKAEKELEVQVPETANFKDIEFRYEYKDRLIASARTCFTRMIDDAGDAALHPESPWGMGVYLYRYGDSPGGYAEMDRAAALAQAAGVKWSREEFSWAGTERKRGEFDFHYYDQVVNTARKHGISVYGLLSYWSDWTKPYTEEGIADFVTWARAVVRHFKDRVKYWEVYNEPNIFFWNGPKELYPLLVKQCYAAIKAEDPEAAVLAVSTSGIDRGFIKRVVDAGAPFDVLTVHPYRPRLVEQGFMRELKDASKLARDCPVWITEMGWSTQIGGTDVREQAQLLARCYLAAVASGVCHNIGWYDFRDDSTDPFYNESNFGVLRQDMTPKPAYRALATVCRTMASGTPRVPKRLPKGIMGIEMDDALAVWSPTDSVTIRGWAKEGKVRVVNLMGDELSPKQNGRQFCLSLAPGCPVFITGAKVKIMEAKPEPRPARVIRF